MDTAGDRHTATQSNIFWVFANLMYVKITSFEKPGQTFTTKSIMVRKSYCAHSVCARSCAATRRLHTHRRKQIEFVLTSASHSTRWDTLFALLHYCTHTHTHTQTIPFICCSYAQSLLTRPVFFPCADGILLQTLG